MVSLDMAQVPNDIYGHFLSIFYGKGHFHGKNRFRDSRFANKNN